MGRSRLTWVGSTVAPWGIALGFLVSITAQAGQETGVDGGPAALRALRVSAFAPTRPDAKPILEAHLTLGSRQDLSVAPDEIEPNPAVKQGRAAFPAVDRAGKADPFVIFRPGFEARRATRPLAVEPAARDWPDESRSPAQVAEAGPPEAYAPLPFGDGATPTPSLDFALNSSTPTPSDGKLLIAAQKPAAQTTVAAQRRCRQARLRGADRPQGLSAADALPRRGDLFRGAQRARGGPGRRRPGCAQPRAQRNLPHQRLRRGLSGPQPPLRLPILLRLRRQVAARRGARRLGDGDAHRPDGRQRRELQSAGRRGAQLSRLLCLSVLGAVAAPSRPHRRAYLLRHARRRALGAGSASGRGDLPPLGPQAQLAPGVETTALLPPASPAASAPRE